MESRKFSVFLKSERLPALLEIAKIIAEFTGTIPFEATQAAKHGWGFLAEELDEAAADKMISISSAHGHPAGKVETTKIPLLSTPIIISKLDFTDGKLNYTSREGQSFEHFENMLVISYAPIRYTFSRTIKTREGPSAGEKAARLGIMMTTGLPIGLGKSREVTREIKNTEVTLYMDLVFLSGMRLMLNSDNFDFSCLREKKTFSSQMNFSLLCLELAMLTPGTFRNTGAYDVLESKFSTTLQYDSPEDMEKETRRLLLLKSHAML